MGGTTMPAYMWPLISVLALILGLLIGVLVGHRTTTAYRHAQAAERELRRLREEQSRYRQRVKAHFVTTAELINRMTDAYREVFRHLVASSQELCGPDAPKLVATEPVARELLERRGGAEGERQVERPRETREEPAGGGAAQPAPAGAVPQEARPSAQGAPEAGGEEARAEGAAESGAPEATGASEPAAEQRAAEPQAPAQGERQDPEARAQAESDQAAQRPAGGQAEAQR